MERFGDFFPENPQTLDELLEVMAQRMAAMQAMLNSMTPEQRAQLQQLMDELLEDMDLRWQMDQLGQHLRSQFPQMGWDRSYNFQGMDPLGFSEAVDMMQQLGDIDQLENLMRGSANPARWPRPTSTGCATSSATTPPAPWSAWPSWPACSRRRDSSRTARAVWS